MYKQCILFLLVGLVAGGPSSNAGRWSKRDPFDVPSPAYECVSSSPSNEQNQDTSSPLNTSEIVADNGLLEKIIKRKEEIKKELKRLRLLNLVAGASANEGVSSSSPNEQSLGSSSPSNEQSQDYTELASPMFNANENVSDNGLFEEIIKEKERLRKALDKYAYVISSCRREINSSKDDILLSKKQIDIYIILQQKRAEELEKQIL